MTAYGVSSIVAGSDDGRMDVTSVKMTPLREARVLRVPDVDGTETVVTQPPPAIA
jgi:hypothetical protein